MRVRQECTGEMMIFNSGTEPGTQRNRIPEFEQGPNLMTFQKSGVPCQNRNRDFWELRVGLGTGSDRLELAMSLWSRTTPDRENKEKQEQSLDSDWDPARSEFGRSPRSGTVEERISTRNGILAVKCSQGVQDRAPHRTETGQKQEQSSKSDRDPAQLKL